jgi:hypothetical protein
VDYQVNVRLKIVFLNFSGELFLYILTKHSLIANPNNLKEMNKTLKKAIIEVKIAHFELSGIHLQ